MSLVVAGNVISDLINRILTKATISKFYVAESGSLRNLVISPDHIIVVGGAPGSGKTSLVGQCVGDFLRLNTGHRALICNVEMTPEELMMREIGRISGVDMTTDRADDFSTEELAQIKGCIATFAQYASRLFIMSPPIFLNDIEMAIANYNPDLVVVDYLQRVNISDNDLDSNERLKISRIMTELRKLVTNRTIIVVSALRRQGKSNYESSEMGLASFRETSEIEYSVNDAYLLVPDNIAAKNGDENRFILRHEKSRGGQKKDINLSFDGRYHRWSGIDDDIEDLTYLFKSTAQGGDSDVSAKVNALWAGHQRQKVVSNEL